jgi:hypothetical protein
MDPVSAFALAANVVSFLDFAGGLLSKGQQIYKSVSGMLSENVEIESVMRELSRQTSLLHGDCSEPAEPDEKLLSTLAKSCSDLGTEILDTLAKLQVRQDMHYRGLRSIGKVLRGVWARESSRQR